MDWNPGAKLNECTFVSSLSVFSNHFVLCDGVGVESRETTMEK